MGIIYPDNVNRGNRVEQLATHIGSLQQEASDSLDRVQIQTGHQAESIDKILKLYNFKTMDELKAKLDLMLTAEQKKKYYEMVQAIRDFDKTTNDILDASLIMSFISGTIGLAAKPIITVLNTGALAAGADLFGRGFRALLRGEEIGTSMIKASFRTFKALSTGVEISETAAKISRIVRTAATVMTIIGVVLDGIILIYQAIEGARQKTELQKATKELCARRFMAKRIEDQLFATEAYANSISGFLVTYKTLKEQNMPEATIKTIMDSLMSNVVTNLDKDLNAITDDSVWAQCQSLDKNSGRAWTDEDPNLDATLAWIQAQPPIDDTKTKSAEKTSVKSVTASVNSGANGYTNYSSPMKMMAAGGNISTKAMNIEDHNVGEDALGEKLMPSGPAEFLDIWAEMEMSMLRMYRLLKESSAAQRA